MGRGRNVVMDDRLTHSMIKRFDIDTLLRKHLAYYFVLIIFLWFASVVCILFFNDNLLDLNLSDAVLITLLTTTSFNVIGMMIIILRNLFPLTGEFTCSK